MSSHKNSNKLVCLPLFLVLFFSPVILAETFPIQRIKIIGLERISSDTVIHYLPVKNGRVDTQKTAEILRALYATDFFSDVRIAKAGNQFVITVVENPVIGLLRISGNKEINDKKLREVLTASGFIEGRVFNGAVLANIKQSLVNEYKNQGYYNVNVMVDTQPEVRHRVVVNIRVSEGKVAKIKKIVFVGNKHFSSKKLLKEMKLSESGFFNFFANNDHYSEVKLNEDLETLRNFYLDRGYIQFHIDSQQVDFPAVKNKMDKSVVRITIHVTEGPIYSIKGYVLDVEGDDCVNKDKLKAGLTRLVPLKRGDIFSRDRIVRTNTAFTDYLAVQGYAFPHVTAEPDVDESARQVFIHFKVKPEHLYYVRRISFSGNAKTSDFVLRREMRQVEGDLYSMSKIEESKRRLSNLGYLENVQVTPSPVPGHTDRVDLNFQVKNY